MNVSIETRPELRVACVRHMGSYSRISEAFARLGELAGAAGLFHAPPTLLAPAGVLTRPGSRCPHGRSNDNSLRWLRDSSSGLVVTDGHCYRARMGYIEADGSEPLLNTGPRTGVELLHGRRALRTVSDRRPSCGTVWAISGAPSK
jgi:hypothetical protein